MRLVYIDLFSDTNSNRFWAQAFRQLAETWTIDCRSLDDDLIEKVIQWKPTHIHFGGSIKYPSRVPASMFEQFRVSLLHARLTLFYGDAYDMSSYWDQIDKYLDNIYMTNRGYLRTRKHVYVPCPAPSDFMLPWSDHKDFDITFIGNNYSATRLEAIKKLRNKYNITVFGRNWPQEFNANPVEYDQYATICSRSWIVLGDPAGALCKLSDGIECVAGDPDGLYDRPVCRAKECSSYKELEGYLSNRLVNTLLSGTVHLVPFVNNMPDWVHGKHLLYYKTEQERDTLIETYLSDKHICKKIAVGAQELAKRYTFEEVAKVIVRRT